jgi:hypothetical protein
MKKLFLIIGTLLTFTLQPVIQATTSHYLSEVKPKKKKYRHVNTAYAKSSLLDWNVSKILKGGN